MAKLTYPQSNKNEKIVFCPHCRVLFEEEEEYKKSEADNNYGYSYKCSDCSEYFNINTYKEQNQNGQNYHFPNREIGKEKIKEYIENIILDLYRNGYSYREICEMTHFSRTTIAKTVQENKIENKISKEKFLRQHLQIEGEDYEALHYKETTPQIKLSLNANIRQDIYESINQSINRSINKALDYGCTIRQISDLFKVSNTTIYAAQSTKYRKNYKKNKIVIEDDEIIISTYKKK